MRNIINILGLDQTFTYLIEYIKDNTISYNDTSKYLVDNDVIHLFSENIKHYRKQNDWYSVLNEDNYLIDTIPQDVEYSKIRVYIPNHSISTYSRGVKYVLTLNTWIADKKIDLGSYVFSPTDSVASNGPIKKGNNEFHEYVEFDIIDPFSVIYSNDWNDFRLNVCKEVKNTNNTCSLLNVSLFVVNEVDERYMMHPQYTGGFTTFNILDNSDLKLTINTSLEPLGLECNILFNKVYDWLLEYFSETYNLVTNFNNIFIQTVIKNKEEVIIGPTVKVAPPVNPENGILKMYITKNELFRNFEEFFSSWNVFEEGWSFVSSLNVIDSRDTVNVVDDIENLSIVSNELPITQDIFSIFVNNGAEKIIDIEDMEIKTYNVVNKIENTVMQIDRPNESKSNIIQPVFFKVKELEMLTLHPVVVENICINLDEYKSKVNKFVLQIDGCKFEQIGANSYGILFKIPANVINSNSGTYYVLNEEYELVTTGKYTCVR